MSLLLTLVAIWVIFVVLGVVLHIIKWLIGVAILATIVVLALRAA